MGESHGGFDGWNVICLAGIMSVMITDDGCDVISSLAPGKLLPILQMAFSNGFSSEASVE